MSVQDTKGKTQRSDYLVIVLIFFAICAFGFLEGVVIEDSVLHDMLRTHANGNRVDAHAIVAGGVRDMVIRRTEAFFVSGGLLEVHGEDRDMMVDRYNARLEGEERAWPDSFRVVDPSGKET